jgi:hypothetical protein
MRREHVSFCCFHPAANFIEALSLEGQNYSEPYGTEGQNNEINSHFPLHKIGTDSADTINFGREINACF